MKLLDLSFAGMGREIARMEGRWPVYQKSTVHNWTRRRDHRRYIKMPVEHRTPLANLLTEWAREQTGNDRLIVSVHMNSPMRARLWVRCGECNTRMPLDLRRTHWDVCRRCEQARYR